MKYSISLRTRFGDISAETARSNDLIDAHRQLSEIARRLNQRKTNGRTRLSRRSDAPKQHSPKLTRSLGRGETSQILREIDSKLLSTSFFSKPKSTGETKDKLDRLGRKFSSRKVSQALGILRKKGELNRTGSRNRFRYRK